MSKFKPGRPSPALVVAIVALVAALGGTAVAAGGRINGNQLLPKSVGGGKFKQFTGGLLKKQTVGAGKIKQDTLGGFQIDEDRLGPVPAAKSVVGDTRYDVKLGFGQSQALATVGPLTLTAQCIQNATNSKGEAGHDIARVLITTTEANSVFVGSAGSKAGDAATGFLEPTTAEGERVAIEYSAPSGSSAYLSGGRVTAYAPAGIGLVSPAGGDAASLNMFNTACAFHGAVLQS
jgi:hypothetical protein